MFGRNDHIFGFEPIVAADDAAAIADATRLIADHDIEVGGAPEG